MPSYFGRTRGYNAYTADKREWYDQLKQELLKRNSKCGLVGENFEYALKYNPFERYREEPLTSFIRENKFDMIKDCKMAGPSWKMDKAKRAYVEVKTKKMCQRVNGFWEPKALNRANNYEDGACFVTPEDAYCATTYQVPDLLRGKHNVSLSQTASQKCNADTKCQWVKLRKGSQDCFSKTAAERAFGRVMNPPPNMPKDVVRDNLEMWLYNWYTNNLPSRAPATGKLIGEGNQCVKQSNPGSESQPGVDVAETGFLPSLPQSVVNMVMKNMATQPENTNKGLLVWASTGSGKTSYATGVMEAFWDAPPAPGYTTPRQIIYASSIDAIAANPDYKFHEAAYRLFPRFTRPPFLANTVDETMANIATGFEQRGVRFLSFAKLANRVQKTEAWKASQARKAAQPIAVGGEAKPRGAKKTANVEALLEAPDILPKKRKTKKAKEEEKVAQAPERKGKKIVAEDDVVLKLKRQNKDKKAKEKVQKEKANQVKVQQNQKPKKTKKAKVVVDVETELKPVPKKVRVRNNQVVDKISDDDFVDLDNAVLIIDEVHNLFRPLANQRERHEYLMKHLGDPLTHPNLKIVILSATPGDNTTDIMKLLNMIRDTREPPITPPNPEDAKDVERFKQSVRGLVSYFDMSGDLSKFPKLEDDGMPVKYPMTLRQFEKYIEKYKETLQTKVGQESMNYDKLAKLNKLNKFWATPRKYANMLYKLEKDMSLTEFSSKLPALLDRIQEYPNEKHYVYSAFYENRGDGGQGIIAIANELDKLGYKKLTVKEAKAAKPETMKHEKRYVLAITNEIGEDGSTSQGKNLGELIRIYNHPSNRNGDIVHVFLASQGFNEGIDLKAVRHLHIFEPLVTWASDIQTLGRARRYCSHADLDRDAGEWSVKVHRYMSEFPTTFEEPLQPPPVVDNTRIEELQKQLDALEKQMDSMKGKRTQEAKDARDELKPQIAEVKKQLKAVHAIQKEIAKKVKKPTKKISTLEAKNAKNVEELVFEESKKRMLELFTIYDSLKSAAIDCSLLKEFHKSTGQDIKCFGVN